MTAGVTPRECVFWTRDDLPTGPLTIWRGTGNTKREVEYVPRSVADSLAAALGALEVETPETVNGHLTALKWTARRVWAEYRAAYPREETP